MFNLNPTKDAQEGVNPQSTTDFVYGYFRKLKDDNPEAVEIRLDKTKRTAWFNQEHEVRIAEIWNSSNSYFVKFFFPNLSTEHRIVTYTMNGVVTGLKSPDDAITEFMVIRAMDALADGEQDEHSKLFTYLSSIGIDMDARCEKKVVTDKYGRNYSTHVVPLSGVIVKLFAIVSQSDYTMLEGDKVNTGKLLHKWYKEFKFNPTLLCAETLKVRFDADGNFLSANTATRRVVSKTVTTTETVEASESSSHADADI
jgi:hypothetical protein